MTDQLPEVAWLVVEPEWQDGDGNPLVGGEWEGHDFTGKGTLFLRADTAIPRAEAEAMVAAAYEDAANSRGMWFGFNSEGEPDGSYCTVREHDSGGMDFYVSYAAIKQRTPADALAAFEQALAAAAMDAADRTEKAMEPEIERRVREAVEAERERIERRVIQACSEIAPGDDACIIEDAMLAAIRDPQETSE